MNLASLGFEGLEVEPVMIGSTPVQTILTQLGKCLNVMNDWETKFVESVSSQVTQGRKLSQKQVDALTKLAANVFERLKTSLGSGESLHNPKLTNGILALDALAELKTRSLRQNELEFVHSLHDQLKGFRTPSEKQLNWLEKICEKAL